MYIIGDIGNTETKVCLVSNKNKIIKKIYFPSKEVTYNKLNQIFNIFILLKKLIEMSDYMM